MLYPISARKHPVSGEQKGVRHGSTAA
jgi:hypothetical protein